MNGILPYLYILALSLGAYSASRIIDGPPLLKIMAALVSFLSQSFLAFAIPGALSVLSAENIVATSWVIALLVTASSFRIRLKAYGFNQEKYDFFGFLFLLFYGFAVYTIKFEPLFAGAGIPNAELFLYHTSPLLFSQEGSIWIPYGFIEHFFLTHEAIAGSFAITVRSVATFLWLEFVFIALYACVSAIFISHAVYFCTSRHRRAFIKILFYLFSALLLESLFETTLIPTKNDFAAGVLCFSGMLMILGACEIHRHDKSFANCWGIVALATLQLGLAAGMKPSPVTTAFMGGMILLVLAAHQAWREKNLKPIMAILICGLIMILPMSLWLMRNLTVIGAFFDSRWDNFANLKVWKVATPLTEMLGIPSTLPPFIERGTYKGSFNFWLASVTALIFASLIFMQRGGWSFRKLFSGDNVPKNYWIVLLWLQFIFDAVLLPGGFFGGEKPSASSGSPTAYLDIYFFGADNRYYVFFIMAAFHLGFASMIGGPKRSATIPLKFKIAASRYGVFSITPAICLLWGGALAIQHARHWEAHSGRGTPNAVRVTMTWLDQIEKPARIAIIGNSGAGFFFGRFWMHSVHRIGWPRNIRAAICKNDESSNYDYIILADGHYISHDQKQKKTDRFINYSARLGSVPFVKKIGDEEMLSLSVYKVEPSCQPF